MFVFEKNILKYKFVFSCQMSLRIMSELLKNTPVLLKILESFCQLVRIHSSFQCYLNQVLRCFVPLCRMRVNQFFSKKE